jgi:dipeptidase E
MNLLLTSAGLTNKTIINSLHALTKQHFNKPLNELSIIFFPTAANAEEGDKDWLIDDINYTYKLGFKEFDIMDFTGLPGDVWERRTRAADILMFGGGNTFHLIHSMETTGMKEVLQEIIEEKIYIGISAGSMVTGTNLSLSQSARMYSESVGEVTTDEGIGLVPFQIRPHLNSKHFPNVRIPQIEEQAMELKDPIYAIDDQTAVVVTRAHHEQKVEVVSEGEWKLL